MLLGASVFIAIINCIKSPRLLALLLAGFILGGIGLSGLGILGTQWIGKVPILGSITAHLPPRIKGFEGAEEGFQPNGIAGGLILFIPLQISLCLSAWRSGAKKRLVFLSNSGKSDHDRRSSSPHPVEGWVVRARCRSSAPACMEVALGPILSGGSDPYGHCDRDPAGTQEDR